MATHENDFKYLLGFIKPTRLRQSTRGELDLLVETESDKGRIINASAFRRLQQKAQVFPLDSNAAVRTRLTHSVEVSQLGRFVAQKVIEEFKVDHFSYNELSAFANTIESACLLHDIGNPPFGHLGESAIREWAAKNRLNSDLVEFDGNPQGYRLMSFLSGLDSFGLNLSCSLLLSTIKYPWTVETRMDDDKKIGVFTTDWKAYEAACSRLAWNPGKKFPFALLMEAADDIAYSMSDLEDGIENDVISLEQLRNVFGNEHFPRLQFKKLIHLSISRRNL